MSSGGPRRLPGTRPAHGGPTPGDDRNDTDIRAAVIAERRARRDSAELKSVQLASALRGNVEHPWSPPGGGPLGALSHDAIHGLDVSAAPGLHGRASTTRVATVLAGMQPRHLASFDVDLDGVELRATDIDWSHGRGEPVTGTAADLLLLACERRVPSGRPDRQRHPSYHGN